MSALIWNWKPWAVTSVSYIVIGKNVGRIWSGGACFYRNSSPFYVLHLLRQGSCSIVYWTHGTFLVLELKVCATMPDFSFLFFFCLFIFIDWIVFMWNLLTLDLNCFWHQVPLSEISVPVKWLLTAIQSLVIETVLG